MHITELWFDVGIKRYTTQRYEFYHCNVVV